MRRAYNFLKTASAAAIALQICAAEDGPVKKALQPLVDADALPGAVTVVATKDGIVDFQAVGYSNVESKTPMRMDSMFWVASMTKPITAAAFMTLVDEGRASVDDPVSKYIPEFENMRVQTPDGIRNAQKPILIRHLLTHMSGLPEAMPGDEWPVDRHTLEEQARMYSKIVLNAEPDMKFQYSNVGINLVGRIIEIVSGVPYAQYVQEKIFNPLGMSDTTFIPSKSQIERLATAYGTNDEKNAFVPTPLSFFTLPLDTQTRQAMPAGGLFSTAEDMLKFCQMTAKGGEYEGKRILSEKSVEEMTKKQTPENEPSPWGLGFVAGGNMFGHAGAMGTNMTVYKDKNLITVFLIQRAHEFPNGGNAAEALFNTAALEL